MLYVGFIENINDNYMYANFPDMTRFKNIKLDFGDKEIETEDNNNSAFFF